MASVSRYFTKTVFIEYYRDYYIIKCPDRFTIYPANKCYYNHQKGEIIVGAPNRYITGDDLMERHRQAYKWIDTIIEGCDIDS